MFEVTFEKGESDEDGYGGCEYGGDVSKNVLVSLKER